MSPTDILSLIKAVIREEADALNNVLNHVDQEYLAAIDLILKMKGKVVVTGMGKSGHIARKIAATMSSTGTLAIFLHPAEAQHGDLGMVSPQDVVIAIGKSGESEEITSILPALKRMGTPIISITADRESTLAKSSTAILFCGIEKEACLFDLAPTSSTTVALAIGDALAITLMKLKNFQPEDFALYHPGGKLGRRLLLRVSDLMIPLSECPILDADKTSIEDVIGLLGSSGLGIVLFSSDGIHLEGILTDGDVRRTLSLHKSKIFEIRVKDLMNPKPIFISSEIRAVEALKQMEARERPLNVVPVVDNKKLVGLVRLHELLKLA